MKYDITTPASGRPLTYEQCAIHMRLPQLDDRSYVLDTIDDATAYAETEMDAALQTQTITATYWDYDSKLYLPRGPVASITSVTANSVAVSSTQYTLKRVGHADYLEIPSNIATPIVVVYVTGYSTLPRDLRRALLMHVSHWYEAREAFGDKALTEVPMGSQAIYQKYRRSVQVA